MTEIPLTALEPSHDTFGLVSCLEMGMNRGGWVGGNDGIIPKPWKNELVHAPSPLVRGWGRGT